MKQIIVLSLLAALLSACAGPKEVVPTDVEVDALAISILEKAIAFRAFRDDCKVTGVNGSREMKKVTKIWWDKNGTIVSAADAFYTQTKSKFVLEVGDEELLPTLKFMLDAEKVGLNVASDKPRSYIAKERKCVAEAKLVEAGKFDVVSEEEQTQADYLRAAFLNKAPGAATLEEVPGVISGVSWQRKGGKSVFSAERLAYEHCPSIQLFLFDSDGSSIENYGVICADEKQFYIRCEWRECALKTQ